MQRAQRNVAALGLVALGGLALVFLGQSVTRCLGPLGRTLVDSIRDGCVDPTAGAGAPVGVLLFLSAILVAFPVRRSGLLAGLIGAVLGGAAATTTYLLARQTSVTGATMTGEVITIPLPIDWAMVLTAVIGGAGIGFLVAGRLLRRATTLRA